MFFDFQLWYIIRYFTHVVNAVEESSKCIKKLTILQRIFNISPRRGVLLFLGNKIAFSTSDLSIDGPVFASSV